ncbi:MAG: two-component regulator propeller domain-containing protein [Ferruginibacter sp.]
MKKVVKLFAVFLIFVFYTSCGQNKTEEKKNSTNSETKDVVTSTGPNTVTRTIKQDRNGNIWIASWDGVFRYDGKSFTNITSKVSSAHFFSVLEDRKGNFWFSSVGSGVFYYDGKSFRNFTTKQGLDFTTKPGLANDQVLDIYEDKTGNIWFGTLSGASRYDGKSFRNYMMNGDSVIEDRTGKSFLDFTTGERLVNQVNSIIEDKTGKFWFGTMGNTFVYDGKAFTVFTHNGKPFSSVRSIIEDKKGNIWLGGPDGLWRYDGTTFTNFTQNWVGYIYEDKNGNIWTTSQNAIDNSWALSRYDEKSLSNKKPTVTEIKSQSRGLFGILEAYDRSIWFGDGDGVHRYDGNTIADFKSKEGQK